MDHKEAKNAKRFDTPYRSKFFTDKVYSGEGDKTELRKKMRSSIDAYIPTKNDYNLYFGEMHGHSNMSDGAPTPDEYFTSVRDRAKLDFAALTDHDHGGVGKKELWVGNPSKWDEIKNTVKKYYEPNKFTTLLGYERDSYPYYNNMVLYFNSHNGEMYRGVRDGEIIKSELEILLKRDDVIVCPHDTYHLESGTDFTMLENKLITPLIELYSRGDACEYFGNPAFSPHNKSAIKGGFWQDALKRGARMGCIGGSDDHRCQNGLALDVPYPDNFPGITGVWAKENTVEGIFEALKARRTYCFMGGRVKIDFRINGHYMGEEFILNENEDAFIYFSVEADTEVKKITLVKNCEDIIMFFESSKIFIDRFAKNSYYYLRVELENGRFAWTSPIWVD